MSANAKMYYWQFRAKELEAKLKSLEQAADRMAEALQMMDGFAVVAPFPRNHKIEIDPKDLLELRKAVKAYQSIRAGQEKA